MVQSHGKATALRYVFHDSRPGSASGSQPQQGAPGSNSVELSNLHQRADNDFGILLEVVKGHDISHEER